MKYKLVIFDFDGTLADSFPWFLHVINDVADRFHFKKIKTKDHDYLRGLDTRRILKYLGVPLWKLPRIAGAMLALSSRDADRIPLFAQTPGLLKGLRKRGVKTVIVSSNSLENIQKILGARNAKLIDHYECGASLFGKRIKLKRVMKEARIPKEQVISIGDETRDIEAARKVGIDCAAVTWGYADEEILRKFKPDFIFNRMDEILKKL